MIQIIWLIDARKDLFEIYNYILRDSTFYAQKTIYEITKKVEHLYDFPYMGRKANIYPNEEFREIIYKSYKIIYEIDSNEVYIHRVWHSARLINHLFLK